MTQPAVLRAELEGLISEGRNPGTMGIDLLSTQDVLAEINREDHLVPAAVAATLPAIAAAVDRVVAAFRQGGRLIYIGAGTSGRLGVLDAAECPPTFGVPEGMVVGILAGGRNALVSAAEGAEDDLAAGAADLDEARISARDVVVGITVSGRTPYVVGALRHARQIGAATVSLCCNPNSVVTTLADVSIAPVVGPEVLTGSTRMKSGSAQKLVLNMLSTASMIRMGKSYQNLMVDLNATNGKLLTRAIMIVMEATGCNEADARATLERTDSDAKLAILVILSGLDVPEARGALHRADGFLRRALALEAAP